MIFGQMLSQTVGSPIHGPPLAAVGTQETLPRVGCVRTPADLPG